MRESNQKYLKNNYHNFRKLANHDDDDDDDDGYRHHDCEMIE
jgi:hypothetical protein